MTITPEQIAVDYPIPAYRFVVSVGDEKIPFNNVSGLDVHYDVIEYKDGTGNYYKMPGQRQSINITLRKGVFPGDTKLFDWINSIQLNQVEKKDIAISLTNETGSQILMTWNVANAFPTSFTSPSFDAASNDIAIQEIALVADRVTIQAP
ncbi:phage tail protein [Photorhabdus laumondii subsp. laumondii]|uniref:Photorhabdus luminescens subsp. laumondii TTO1 complete genome segment 6/17 n=2 Tax=Photorhabdus laumondii subsp. laumondii TaxID=141679 RepID=Q7N676_PHOLL|nr:MULTISPECIES: phage tail protein [Photorhabdus]AWK41531.1 phage tail protein [Photorhabdus laumondii subsp. laumondii]AXG42331.1 phage tail protein [Photorhabdus laumondii subsp. laumondii]AXG46854.1 phage tail protein [Photorhabdus laumondii subsp. laumondii]KTL61420.1 phage tail protein [Photorhabdus laumondii subsp. laumondii]MCC8382155.1 phage tail protein [Photorhabdus laumondii]